MSLFALLFDSVPLQRAGAGVCARRRSGFLLRRQKKVTKEKATLHAASPHALAGVRGNLRCSRPAGSRSNSLRFTALRQSRSLIRWPLRSSAHPEGNPTGSDIHTGHCFAALRSAPSRGRKRHALRTRGRAKQRPVWMFGCSAVPPLLAAPATGRLRGEHGRRSAHAS